MQKRDAIKKRPIEIFGAKMQAFDVLKCLIESADLRISAQEEYERALVKSVQKLNGISTSMEPYAQIISHYKTQSTERVFHVRKFRQEISKEAEFLRQEVHSLEITFQDLLLNSKRMQKSINSDLDKLLRDQSELAESIQETDERLILRDLSNAALTTEQLSVRREHFRDIVQHQGEDISRFIDSARSFGRSKEKYKQQLEKMHVQVNELSYKGGELFVEYLKKMNVEEISLIRNIQYDIDNMLKRTDLFNLEMKEPKFCVQEELKMPDDLEVQAFYQDSSQESQVVRRLDVYKELKQQFLGQGLREISSTFKVENQSPAIDILSNTQAVEAALKRWKADLAQSAQDILQVVRFHYARHEFVLKTETFKNLSVIFDELFPAAYSSNNFRLLTQLINYSRCYVCEAENPSEVHLKRKKEKNYSQKSIFECISKSNRFLQSVHFWLFYIYFQILSCLQHNFDSKIYGDNSKEETLSRKLSQNDFGAAIYKILLDNSLIILGLRIQKYEIKNLLAKILKSQKQLSEDSLVNLLHFVDGAYEKLHPETVKKKRKAKKSKGQPKVEK